MADAVDWATMEEGLGGLLPYGGISPDRPLLLQSLLTYANLAVREGRRRGAIVPTEDARARALRWLEHPVFLCGHHRTGTTLLQTLLDGHPELRVLPSEGTYLTTFAYAACRNASPEATDRFAAEWVCRLVNPNYEPHFLLGRSGAIENPSVLFVRRLLGWQSALRDGWSGRAPFVLLLALVAAYGDVASPRAEPRLWVEKTPLNESRVATLAAAFPNARFIHLVREPMVTLASVIEAYRSPNAAQNDQQDDGDDGCFRHTWRLRHSFRLAGINQARLRSRYLVLRYEDLATAPTHEMERVCSFLGIPSSPALATPSVLGHPVRSNSSFERGAAGVVVPPRSSPALSPRAAELVRAVVASRARALGYAVPPVPFLRRLALLVREAPRYARDRVAERVAERVARTSG